MKKLEKAEGSDGNWQTDRGGASCSVLVDHLMVHFIYRRRSEVAFPLLRWDCCLAAALGPWFGVL